MRKKIVAGNWKMNTTVAEGVELAKAVVAKSADVPCDVTLIVGTPFTHLCPVAEALKGSKVELSAENCADKEKGAYTGEISAAMVASTGASWTILGHSERRQYYGETDEKLVEKTKLALAAGPLTEFMEPYGDLEEEDVDEIYTEMFEAGIAAGAQCITIQTFMELEMMRVAAAAAKRFNVPVYCTMTFEKSGKTLMGNSVKDIIAALSPLNIDAIGMNCSLGPVAALPIIREFRENTDIPLMYKPNAGLPITASDGTVTSAYTPAQFVEELKPAFDFVSYIGGCCGTDASFTKALSEALK